MEDRLSRIRTVTGEGVGLDGARPRPLKRLPAAFGGGQTGGSASGGGARVMPPVPVKPQPAAIGAARRE